MKREGDLAVQHVIAIVDDDESLGEALSGLLRSFGYIVAVFHSAEEFLGSAFLTRTYCLIADVHMPGMSGLELYGRLSALGMPIPTIFITARFDAGLRARALSEGAKGYLSKPFSQEELLACVRSALKEFDHKK